MVLKGKGWLRVLGWKIAFWRDCTRLEKSLRALEVRIVILLKVHEFTGIGCEIAVILTNTLIRDYLLNYARTLIYTTSLSYANIVSVNCSFDMLEDGTAHQVHAFFFESNRIISSHHLSYVAIKKTFQSIGLL